MASKTKNPTLPLPAKPEPRVGDQIPGMAELEAAALDVHARLADVERRKAEAVAVLNDSLAQRAALMQQARAGEVVQAQQLSEVEQAVRLAEANVLLLDEALPALRGEVDAAEAKIRNLAEAEAGEFRKAVVAYGRALQDASNAVARLIAEASTLSPASYGLDRIGEADSRHRRHAPASFERLLARRAEQEQEKQARQEADNRRAAAELAARRASEEKAAEALARDQAAETQRRFRREMADWRAAQ